MALSPQALRAKRRALQIIFQDPYSSLNPRMTVGQTLVEPLALHGLRDGPAARAGGASCWTSSASRPQHLQRYPHEFSGGQRQRIGIARALAVEPRLIVCDEPVSALDVSIQAQVVNLLQDLQRSLGLAYVFIAHDLAVVKHIATHVAVMYLGHIVEIADKRSLFASAAPSLHAGAAVGDPGARAGRSGASASLLQGDVPSPIDSAVGLPLPHPLPVCARALRRRRCRPCALVERPLGGLPFLARDRRRRPA